MTAYIIPHPAVKYRAPFSTVDAAYHLPQIATSHRSTPEAAQAACRWLASQEPDADRRAFWDIYGTRRGYDQEMH